jgi:hypothetical protein
LINARYEEEFVFHDGTRAKNLLELVLKLEHLTTEEFNKFVNLDKNDFSNWINYVLKDKFLADILRNVKTCEETIYLIKNRMDESFCDVVSFSNKAILNTSENKAYTGNNISLLDQSAIHVSPNIARDTTIVSSKPSAHSSFSNMSNMLNDTKDNSTTMPKDIKASRNWFKLLLEKNSFKKRLEDTQSSHQSSVQSSNQSGSTLNTNSNNQSSDQSHNSSNNLVTNNSNIIKLNNTLHENKINAHKSYHDYLFKKRAFLRNLQNLKDGRTNKNNSLNTNDTKEETEHENALWFVLYVILIILIVSLLVYKLFLS